jgi:hypothetical protein
VFATIVYQADAQQPKLTNDVQHWQLLSVRARHAVDG